MKKNYTLSLFKCFFAVLSILSFHSAIAQIEFRYLTGFGTALFDINDSGNAVRRGGTYSFSTNIFKPLDTAATSLAGINNQGDLIGTMPIVINGTTIDQPGYKKNGMWHAMGYFPGATDQASVSVGQISENGNFITGQMSIDCCSSQAFLYNISTSIIEEIADPANEYSAGYCVNDSGIIGGWYDPQPSGTLRVPAYMTTGSIITSVPSALPSLSSTNQVSAINNSNIMVGDRDGVPFIFNKATNSFTAFQIPAGYTSATFTSISENGIAVGYCQNTFPNIVRDAIVYHPSLGSQPILISGILATHGITSIPTIDGLLGTAISISPNGNFICGWENAFAAFASGWVINFSDSLISDCFLTCPQDIFEVSLSGPKVINYTIPITCSNHGNITAVLASGLPSGSSFPIGTTIIVHNLVDTNGVILNSCTFSVVLSDHYCNPSLVTNTIESITLVKVADINNVSTALPLADYEDFTNIIGNVELDSSYTATFEGSTGGNFSDYFTVYVDWNQDGLFNDSTEKYDMGSITQSTGTDGIQTSGILSVPSTALLGTTTMRVLKNYNQYVSSPCSISSGYGQVEDYKLNIINNPTQVNSLGTFDFTIYPNPVNDLLFLNNKEIIKWITISTIVGQEEIHQDISNKTGQVNVSGLVSGMYIMKVLTTTGIKTIKFNKR